MIRLVLELDHDGWVVKEHFELPGAPAVVPGDTTDLASIPAPLLWLTGRETSWTPAAVTHDQLWRLFCPSGLWTYREADQWLREELKRCDVAFLRRWFIWAGVRLGALSHRGHRLDVVRDLPRILPVALVAGPIVAPTTVFAVAGKYVFWAVSMVAWKLFDRGAPKRRPRIFWK